MSNERICPYCTNLYNGPADHGCSEQRAQEAEEDE
jgi:hypothetical protein